MLIFILGLMIFASSCSTEYHLRRLEAKGVGITTDTVKIPELKIDTFYAIDTVEIYNDLDSIFTGNPNIPDTCQEIIREIVLPEVIRYVSEGNIITDTLMYADSLITSEFKIKLSTMVYQEGTSIVIKSWITDSEIFTKDIITVEDKSFFKKWQEIVLLLIMGVLALITLKSIFNGRL